MAQASYPQRIWEISQGRSLRILVLPVGFRTPQRQACIPPSGSRTVKGVLETFRDSDRACQGGRQCIALALVEPLSSLVDDTSPPP
jgi:hypothetical protein